MERSSPCALSLARCGFGACWSFLESTSDGEEQGGENQQMPPGRSAPVPGRSQVRRFCGPAEFPSQPANRILLRPGTGALRPELAFSQLNPNQKQPKGR